MIPTAKEHPSFLKAAAEVLLKNKLTLVER